MSIGNRRSDAAKQRRRTMAPRVRELPPASEVDPAQEEYFFRVLKTPVLSGVALSAFTSVYEGSLGSTIYRLLSSDSGVHQVRARRFGVLRDDWRAERTGARRGQWWHELVALCSGEKGGRGARRSSQGRCTGGAHPPGRAQVLHEITIPEQPLFLPHCPVKEAEDPEPGCDEVQGTNAVEVITTLLQQGWAPELHLDSAAAAGEQPAVPAAGYRRPTVADYVAAYRSGEAAGRHAGGAGKARRRRLAVPAQPAPPPPGSALAAHTRAGLTTPTEAMDRVIAFIERSQARGCKWFTATSAEEIRKQAQASTERWAAGKPLSFLDGALRRARCPGVGGRCNAWPCLASAPASSYCGRASLLHHHPAARRQCKCTQVCRTLSRMCWTPSPTPPPSAPRSLQRSEHRMAMAGRPWSSGQCKLGPAGMGRSTLRALARGAQVAVARQRALHRSAAGPGRHPAGALPAWRLSAFAGAAGWPHLLLRHPYPWLTFLPTHTQGKANLHEVGLGVTGLNQRTGTPLNPYNLEHFTGGSSSGSAALLAAGLCPLAIGEGASPQRPPWRDALLALPRDAACRQRGARPARCVSTCAGTDGGGSIRIPSSFCGESVGLRSCSPGMGGWRSGP